MKCILAAAALFLLAFGRAESRPGSSFEMVNPADVLEDGGGALLEEQEKRDEEEERRQRRRRRREKAALDFYFRPPKKRSSASAAPGWETEGTRLDLDVPAAALAPLLVPARPARAPPARYGWAAAKGKRAYYDSSPDDDDYGYSGGGARSKRVPAGNLGFRCPSGEVWSVTGERCVSANANGRNDNHVEHIVLHFFT